MDKIRLTELIAPKYYGLHRALKEDRFDEYFLKGGRGSAKSSFVSIEIIIGLLRHPDANAIVYRRVAATLREPITMSGYSPAISICFSASRPMIV